MLEISIITGKAWTGNPSASNAIKKRLYLKIFPGEFWYRAPRAKKAKVYGGELFVRYSSREWPEKKNGPLVGDPGLLSGISDLLREVKLKHADDLIWAKKQQNFKETLTLTVGNNLAREMVDRGFARVVIMDEPTLPKEPKPQSPTHQPVTTKQSVVNDTPVVVKDTPVTKSKSVVVKNKKKTDAVTQTAAEKVTIDSHATPPEIADLTQRNSAESMAKLYGKVKSGRKKAPPAK